MLVPDLPLGLRRIVLAAVRNAVADQHDEKAFDAKLAAGVVEQVAGESGRAIFVVELEQRPKARDVRLGAAALPERRVEARVEAVVQREEIADLVPRVG